MNTLVGLGLLGLVELVYSSSIWLFFPEQDFWIFEHPGRTIHFHPVKGYDLTQTPSRFSRIMRGKIEYTGIMRGNAQGFPDRDDFTVEYPEGVARRLAVFGDSFSSAQFLSRNWPDRVEDTLNNRGGKAIELLNFSTDGGGLANWASNLEGILVSDHYAIDGIIFAVYGEDLQRKFSFSDARGRKRYAFARTTSWDPDHYPKTHQAADAILKTHEVGNAYILTSEEYDAAMAGSWRPARQWEFQVLGILRHYASRGWHDLRDWLRQHGQEHRVTPFSGMLFTPGQMKLIQRIRDYVDANVLPVLVVTIPDKMETGSGATPPDATHFAELLGARLVDGREAFSDIAPDERHALWFPYDQHWNQAGSDVFAEFMTLILASWPVAN